MRPEGETMISVDEWTPQHPNDKKVALACKDRVQSVVGKADVILFGSRARGNASAQGDFDLLVLVAHSLSAGKGESLNNALLDLEMEEDCIVSEIVLDQESWESPLYRAMPLHDAVDRDGVAL